MTQDCYSSFFLDPKLNLQTRILRDPLAATRRGRWKKVSKVYIWQAMKGKSRWCLCLVDSLIDWLMRWEWDQQVDDSQVAFDGLDRPSTVPPCEKKRLWESSTYIPWGVKIHDMATSFVGACLNINQWYCWWLKSCTSWYGKYPIIYRVSAPSQVVQILAINSSKYHLLLPWWYWNSSLQTRLSLLGGSSHLVSG